MVFAFRGGGPPHAGAYARELGVKQVVVPLGNCAAVWSALGTYVGGVVHVYDRNEFMREPLSARALNRIYTEMEQQATTQLAAEGFQRSNMDFERFISLKYGAQNASLEIPYPKGGLAEDEAGGLIGNFEATFRRYGEGAGFREAGVEVMKLRLRAVGRLPEVNPKRTGTEAGATPAGNGHVSAPVIARRRVYWWEAEDFSKTPVLDGDRLALGQEVSGPAIIELPHTTMPVRPRPDQPSGRLRQYCVECRRSLGAQFSGASGSHQTSPTWGRFAAMSTTAEQEYKVIGTRPIRHDGIDKVTGRAKYGADYSWPDMLHGKVLRSPHSHARIKSINVEKALRLPGVKAIVTGQDLVDLPGRRESLGEMMMNPHDISHNILARDKVMYIGQRSARSPPASPHIAKRRWINRS